MMRVKFSNNDSEQLELDFREEIQKIAEHNIKLIFDSWIYLKEQIEKKEKSKQKQIDYSKTLDLSNSSPNKILSVKERISKYEDEINSLKNDLNLTKDLLNTCKVHYRINHKLDLIYDFDKKEFKSKLI